ncbi:GNAT family N-acetyltransferase [Desulfitobacterium sp. Sab5]|uniref:GNAT family N-acetyltransferase n=1 Tax=Desulfitobacterium nosdiversum TaxID=3375356 RepID=UPI003CF089E7
MKYSKLKSGQILVIREAQKEDAPKILDYIDKVSKESDNLTFGEGEFGITLEKEAELIEEIFKSNSQLMICAFIDDQLIGQLVFRAGSRPRIRHSGEFGITVLKEYWGMGIGKELLSYLIAWAKETQIIRKINLKVRSDNLKAIGLYTKIGFISEGTMTREMFINGQFYSSIHMGMEIN